MTDNEIIKALECHIKGRCHSCPNGKEEIQLLHKPCSRMIAEYALSLINRQKAEIEDLKDDLAQVDEAFITMREMMVGYKTKLDDAVPVTHCADCQHCALDYADRGFGYPTKPIRVCIIHDHETTLDDYCSWARRKDGEEDD